MAGIERRSYVSNYKEPVDSLGIFVPREEEQEYLEKHNLQLEVLDNGAIFAAGHREVGDLTSADFQLTFPNGAYFDIPGKVGLRHILEHLIAKKPWFLASKTGASFNAETSAAAVTIYLQGTSNVNYREYGTWPVFETVFEKVINDLDTTEEQLEIEKLVCIEENFHRTKEHDFLVSKANSEVFLSKDNPYQIYAGGTNEEIARATLEDMNNLSREVFVPKNMWAQVFTEGDIQVFNENVLELRSRVLDMPRADFPYKKLNFNLYSQQNPDFRNGEIYLKDIGLRNNIVNLELAWAFPFTPFDREDLAYANFSSISTRFREFIRGKGMSYVDFAGVGNHGDNLRIVTMGVKTSRKEDMQNIAASILDGVKNEVLGGVKEEDIENNLNLRRKQLSAVPITSQERFSDMLTNFSNFGRIVDSENSREALRQIRGYDIQDVIDRLVSTRPAILITGDLS